VARDEIFKLEKIGENFMTSKMELFEKSLLKEGVPEFNVGDVVKVYVKIQEEEGKTRLQAFEGIVIRRRGKGAARTFTVRRISYGEGVERTFPLNSPHIDKIEVVKKGKVKRAKIYYLRDKVGKKTKVEEDLATNQEDASEDVSQK
jgi:large subunit ribosomal protein L19